MSFGDVKSLSVKTFKRTKWLTDYRLEHRVWWSCNRNFILCEDWLRYKKDLCAGIWMRKLKINRCTELECMEYLKKCDYFHAEYLKMTFLKHKYRLLGIYLEPNNFMRWDTFDMFWFHCYNSVSFWVLLHFGETGMTKVNVAFRNFASAPKKFKQNVVHNYRNTLGNAGKLSTSVRQKLLSYPCRLHSVSQILSSLLSSHFPK